MPAKLRAFYQSVRQRTLKLTENLTAEDMVAQSMTEASPSKWHLAHTTWFFEELVLRRFQEDYKVFDEQFSYLFNSYYESLGERHPRFRRGVLTRPALSGVLHYRAYVDGYMQKLIQRSRSRRLADLVTTGLHHEMQHQELLLTDILNLLSFNPLAPAVLDINHSEADQEGAEEKYEAIPLRMESYEGGLIEIGASDDEGFSYDCERPRHQYFLQPYRLANRCVTNGEWLAFINDGGYQNPLLWLTDGWEVCQREQWQAPLYWRWIDGEWRQYGLDGLQTLNFAAPVCHISYYEADAYARWAGKRLPREQEWEHSAESLSVEGNFLENNKWRPQGVAATDDGLAQMYGDVWEWTCSPFIAYPGFKAEAGVLQEYNGKFMANQFVLRGGSCVTPQAQIRSSYRNFFYPHQRWQFSGLRLAEDA